MAPDPKILILEQSRNEATRMIESGLVIPGDGESKTKAINRISEEIFFKKLQEYFAKQNPITNTNDDFDDLTSPHLSLPKIVLWLISLPFCILISFNAGMTEISQSLVLLPCIFGIIVFSRTPYLLFGILSLSFLSYMAGSILLDAINSVSFIHYFPSQ
tara:strand:- start:145 stop:621 length:477 start_codon:yes stop_codon:yes gene_type:complete